MAFVDELRSACAEVAAGAEHVRVEAGAIDSYAPTLPAAAAAAPAVPGADDEERAARLITLNAINFGSGWFPTLRKRFGMSGFRTVEAGLRDHGPWAANELVALGADELGPVLGQDPGHELIGLFVSHLRELGHRVRDDHNGSFLSLARAGRGSAVRLAELLAAWPGWRDVSRWRGLEVPFLKRAQICASELALAELAPAGDLGSLTIFADNLVPHVLRLDGVLSFEPSLVERIDRGERIEHGSAEEVEIRACALHAVELLVAAHGSTTAAAVDNALWHRGSGRRYKAVPRHRSRTTAY